jgi:acetyl esterase/lipase
MSVHVIVLPGGGYVAHAEHEGEPVASWLSGMGLGASVFRYPLRTRHPEQVNALQTYIKHLRADGADTIGVMGFSAGGHLGGDGRSVRGRRRGIVGPVRSTRLLDHFHGD